MNAPTFIAKSTKVSQAGTGGVGATANLPYMGSILPGDKLYILAMVEHPGALIGSLTLPAGFVGLGANTSFSDNSPAYAGNISVWERTADGTESGTVAVFGFSDVNMTVHAQMYQFRSDPSGKRVLVESISNKGDGNGNTTITFNAVTLGGNARTLLGFVAFRSGSPATPSGYVQAASDSNLILFTKHDTGTDGAVTAAGGGSSGWATTHFSIYSPAGRSFVVN